MLSYQPLPGSLNGWMDKLSFSYYWNAIKDKIQDLYNLGYQISLWQQKLGIAYTSLKNRGRQDLADQLQPEIDKAADDLAKWWKVKGLLDTWLPKFMQASQQPAEDQKAALGILPLVILGAAGIGALAYIVTTGMALMQDYQFKKNMTQAVIEGKMTSGQVADIVSAEASGGGILGKIGLGFGIGVPTALLVGVGAYFIWTSGMLKGILPTGGSHST